MTVAADLLRATRLASGLSTRGLARQAGTAPARLSEVERSVHDPSVGTLDRVLRSAGWQLIVVPTRAPTAAIVALSIVEHGTEGDRDEERAFRALLCPT
jgi:transcriptional regulator with XRE-family HTH domain